MAAAGASVRGPLSLFLLRIPPGHWATLGDAGRVLSGRPQRTLHPTFGAVTHPTEGVPPASAVKAFCLDEFHHHDHARCETPRTCPVTGQVLTAGNRRGTGSLRRDCEPTGLYHAVPQA